LSEKKIGKGRTGQKRSERNAGITPVFLWSHCQQTDETPGNGTRKNNKRQGLPAEKGTDHGQKLDISSAHTFLFSQKVVKKGYGVKNPSSCQDADQGIQPIDERVEKGKAESDGDSRQA
jgi:hypothetical protein